VSSPTLTTVSNGTASSVLLDADAGMAAAAAVAAQGAECEAPVRGASAPPGVELQPSVSGGPTETMTTTTTPLPNALLVQTTCGSKLLVMPANCTDSTPSLTHDLSPVPLDVTRL